MMRQLGYVLFLAGIVLSSWYAARPITFEGLEGDRVATTMERMAAWGSIAGVPFGIGILLMVSGGVIARRAERNAVKSGGDSSAADSARSDTRQMVQEIADAVVALPSGDPRENAHELHEQLDRILEDLVPAFLEQRERCVAEWGLVRYAEMSGTFASAERSLARAWSALTDEVWGEVPACLDTAKRSMAEALRITAAS